MDIWGGTVAVINKLHVNDKNRLQVLYSEGSGAQVARLVIINNRRLYIVSSSTVCSLSRYSWIIVTKYSFRSA